VPFDLFGVVLTVALIDPLVAAESGGVEFGLRRGQQVEMVAGVLAADQHREQPV
jgi:hypothetical protein